MRAETRRLIYQLVDTVIGDREDRRVLRPVLLAYVQSAVADFERYFDRRHAANRVRDFDILMARNKAAKGAPK